MDDVKMLYCRKCGTPVVSDETLLQSIQDRIDEAQDRAHKEPGSTEKGLYLHEAAEYKAMYKALLHNITKREYAEAVVPYVLRELLQTVKSRKLLSDAEIAQVYARGQKQAKAVQAQTRVLEKQIYRDFEAACNRSKPDRTADAAIASADRKPRTRVWRAKD